MVFLKRSIPANPKKRPAPPSVDIHPSVAAASAATLGPDPHRNAAFSTNPVGAPATESVGGEVGNAKGKGIRATGGDDEDPDMRMMVSLLAEAGCTLRVSGDAPPSLPSNPHKFRRHIESRLTTAEDPSILPRFLSGFASYIQDPQNLRRVLIPASHDGGCSTWGESLTRVLLLVAPIQPQMLNMLLEKLPEHFIDVAAQAGRSLKDDIARLIVNQLRWLDFLVDSGVFAEKLMEALSISPPELKKEIIGSLPEIIGDKSHATVVAALEKILMEDSEVIVPVLDSFTALNLDEQLQEQVVTIALSHIRTVDVGHIAHLLRFLLLSATPQNAGRIITQIRDQLKFIVAVDPCSARNKKLKEKSIAENTEVSIFDALRSSLRFKNILCEAVLKELKSLDQSRLHKAIDIWFLMLIYSNGGSLQKDAQKIFKKKIVNGCFCEALFDQCITGQRELVKDHFASFVSLCEYLLSCKEKQVRNFGIHLYTSLFEEFKDTYSRQEVLGALVTHIGSGIAYEVSSALETLIVLSSRYTEDLIPISSHVTGILDYMECFQEDNLHKVYEVFSSLALSARSRADTVKSSIANEVFMIIRKQVSNTDMRYKKMGIIGTLKIVSTLGNAKVPSRFLSSQKSNSDDALELLQMSLDSCKSVPLTLILFYDELIALLEDRVLKPEIIEWIGKHVSEFEPMFLSDLERGQLPSNISCDGIEGELWINLDGDASPIVLKILPLLTSSLPQQSDSLQILPSQFLLLSVVERLSNQGSLGGIDALLGCPLHLPSPKYFSGIQWKKLTEKQKKIVCLSLFHAVNWIRELLNAFSSQIADKVESVTPNTKDETVKKLSNRLRSLVVMESILDGILKPCPLSLPEVCYSIDQFGQNFQGKKGSERVSSEVVLAKQKKKHKTDPSASGNLDPNGMLRQPTIIDALNKAALASQEGLDEGSPRYLSHEKTQRCASHCPGNADEVEVVDLSAESKFLDAQRSKFRPLNADSLSLLSYSECKHDCCADPAAELPLHLYLLRELRRKLNDFSSPIKQCFTACPDKASPGMSRMASIDFLIKIKSAIGSLRKHLDNAISILRDGPENCQNHWKSQSCSAGIPELSNLMMSESSVASSVFREVLRCYSLILSIGELYHGENLRILKDLLEVFQPTEALQDFFSGLQQHPAPGSIDYMYCGVYSFLEGILEKSFFLSFLLASEVVAALQSLVNSMAVLIKSQETKGKNINMGCSQNILDFLRKRLSISAHKLLAYDWSSKDSETEWKGNGDFLQKILKIYLTNSESTSELLDELACSILPQALSVKTITSQDATHGFPTLGPTTLLTWYRVLHEENINVLSKLVKEVKMMHGKTTQREAAEKMLLKIQQSVHVVVSLVSLCKIHDKVAMHAMAVKYGGKFVDLFLKAFDFLQAQFQSHYELIIQMFKEFQKATRVIQALCSEAKGSKRTMVTSKVPATKRSLEKFLFHVKALLHNNSSSGCTFWMGNLKHKDLQGQVVSSQLYEDDDANQVKDPNRNELPESVGDCEDYDAEN
ncbi:Fanconi anemia group D2 protein homolog isoform X2 [Phalaenopsis equestris]|uniref:Fanconi anemia group D2 protein homolog isoform X2 n=1 Tax=Phalaenopsis equestris TaxID=78828 RepID=UPI0009E24239|nr:Fanconi anemia group D2 protein homolog isoform X2 [Phalaenopsis equestris]